jgi:exodeoxyribonuclease VII small subunit
MAEEKDTLKYEEAMKQLEEIVARMENGDVGIESLNESLKKAQGLVKLCRDRLMKIEKQIADSSEELG